MLWLAGWLACLEVLLVEAQRRARVLDRVVRLALDALPQELGGEEAQRDLPLLLEAPQLHRVDHLRALELALVFF